MSRLLIICFSTLALMSAESFAQTRQDPESLREAVEKFVYEAVRNLPGEVAVSVESPDPRLKLAQCAQMEPFLPAGGRLWGSSTVGLRCRGAWTVYVPVIVKVTGDVLVAARGLAAGEIVSASDLAVQKQDLTRTGSGALSDPAAAIGKTVARSLAAAQVLRPDMLRAPAAVTQGQAVRVVASRVGFSVTSEGQALKTAADGDAVQVRTTAGQLIRGIARPGGIVEVQ